MSLKMILLTLITYNLALAKINILEKHVPNNIYLEECLKTMVQNTYHPYDVILTRSTFILSNTFPVITSSLNDEIKTFQYSKISTYILDVTSDDDFMEIMEYLGNQKTFNPRAKFFLITYQPAYNISFVLSKYFIKNAVIVKFRTHVVQHIYNFNLYRYGNVENSHLNCHLIGKCVRGQPIFHRTLFPVKVTKNWSKTTINAVHTIVPPYIICVYCEGMRGIQMELLEAIQKILKFNIRYSFMPNIRYDIKKPTNNTYTAILHVLEEKWADMAIGFFRAEAEEHLDFDTSFPYIEDTEHFIVPKSDKMPHWKRIAYVFHKNVLFFLLILALLIILFSRVIYHISCARIGVALCQILLENTTGVVPKTSAFRMLMIGWTVASLIVSTAFKNRLMLILLMDQHEYQMNTIEDVGNSKLKIHWQINTKENYYSDCEDEIERRIFYKLIYSENSRRDVNATAFRRDRITTSIVRNFYYYLPKYYLDQDGQPLLHLIGEKISSWQTQIYFVKGYPLFEQIDRLLMQLRANGVVYKLYDKYAHEAKLALSKSIKIKAEEFGLKHLEPAFTVLSIGCGFGLVFFIVELFLEYRNNRNFIKTFEYLP